MVYALSFLVGVLTAHGDRLPVAPPAASVTLWTAEWCGWCKPAHDQLDELYREGWPVKWTDFDEKRQEAERKRIAPIPCYVITRGSEEVARRRGFVAKKVLIEWFIANGLKRGSKR